jgi:hypothetical protein
VVLHNTYFSYFRLQIRENPIANPGVFKIIAGVNAMDRTQILGCFSGLKFWGNDV